MTFVFQFDVQRRHERSGTPSPLGGEGWGEGANSFSAGLYPLTRRALRADLSPQGRGEERALLGQLKICRVQPIYVPSPP